MAQSDPTDNALAAIAKHSRPTGEPSRADKTAIAEQKPVTPPSIPAAPAPIEAHGYSEARSRTDGRDPLQVDGRLDNGDYYVDETIGGNSAPSSLARLSRTPRSSWWTIAKATPRRASNS